MDSETEFDTDIMILDYVCSKATHALLLTRIAELSNRPAYADIEIFYIFDTWHHLTTHKHGATRQLSRDIEAKLRLISFTAHVYSRARKCKWRRNHSKSNETQGGDTLSNTAYMTMLEILRVPREEQLDDKFQVWSLMELFPDFLELCSAMSITEDERGLIEVLGKYLIQAVLEQYTLFGKTATEAISDAHSLISSHQHTDKTRATKWLSEIQSSHFAILLPTATASQPGESHETHLNCLAQEFPAFDFEAMLVMRLQAFLFGLETPVLVKLETGEMDLYNQNYDDTDNDNGGE